MKNVNQNRTRFPARIEYLVQHQLSHPTLFYKKLYEKQKVTFFIYFYFILLYGKMILEADQIRSSKE